MTIDPRGIDPVVNLLPAIAADHDLTGAFKMIRRALVVMAAVLSITPASAERIAFVGGWQIERIMTPQYKACAMTAEFENGARLAFARAPSAPGQVFVIVGNASGILCRWANHIHWT